MDRRIHPFWGLTLLAAAVLMVTMGVRQSMGLFVAPINSNTALGYATISFALAVAQFVWGAVQPVAGAIADRYGHVRVVVAGVLLLALGNALAPLMPSAGGLVFTIGVLSAAGAGAASFSVLIGAVAQRLPVERRGMASGVINAGASLGQFVFAPVAQLFIGLFGWMGALWSLAVITLSALPLSRALRSPAIATTSTGERRDTTLDPTQPGLKAALRYALRDRSYLMLHAGFFTCGFHVAFLVTHLPGEVALCGLSAQVASWSLAIIGLANIFGSLAAGWAVQYYRSKYVLFWMYGSRAIMIGLYLLAPKTALTFYLFAIGLGFTWLGTVPPTANMVGKLFGTRYLATLFGLTLLSHQTGGFFGAWLGGLAFAKLGNYELVWYADILLAVLAALCNLPIREARIVPVVKPA